MDRKVQDRVTSPGSRVVGASPGSDPAKIAVFPGKLARLKDRPAAAVGAGTPDPSGGDDDQGGQLWGDHSESLQGHYLRGIE